MIVALAGGIITTFISKDNKGVYEYGLTKDSAEIFSYDQPDTLLSFPLEIGKTWQNSYQVNSGTESMTTMLITRKVISKNKLLVRIGMFEDAYMVQEKRTQVIGGKTNKYIYYIWYVPYVGEVARIQSLENETNEIFSQAGAYRRLWYTSYSGPE